jgi:hypothetical protein
MVSLNRLEESAIEIGYSSSLNCAPLLSITVVLVLSDADRRGVQ